MKVAVNGKIVDIGLVETNIEVVQMNYNELVEQLIRERYTLGQELAILRQRDTKPEEFAEYNAYAEKCKTQAKEQLKG